jgi:hypothetical protein
VGDEEIPMSDVDANTIPIQALRQAAAFLRGDSTPTQAARDGWAAELDRLADIEVAEHRAHESKSAYRNIRNYLVNELHINDAKVAEIVGRIAGQSIEAAAFRAVEARRMHLDSMIKAAVREIAGAEVRSAVEAMVKSRISVTVG